MEEELQKRNTDCVYFLASPLTCKKGIECEYRHSEIARLNPRDCWYWLAGSCLNPTCAFRHPPLDGKPEKSSESAPHYDHTTVPVNKTDVPCFFFFNGLCNKGDKCTFLHGPDDTTHAWKSSKTASTLSHAILLEKKISTGSDTGSTHANPNPSETVPIKAADDSTQDKAKQEFQQLAPNNVEEESDSPRMMSASEGDEAEGFIQRRSLVCMDQSSEEDLDGGHIEREDWLESSPGFDVLVDDRLENLGYEDDPEYLLNDQSTVFDYEDPVEFNPEYQEGRILYEQEIHSFGDLDNEHTSDYIRKVPVHSRERMLNPLPGRKRKFLPTENSRRGVDLRDHLKKRRVFDGHFETRFSRRHSSVRLIGRSRERPRWQGSWRQHGRLSSAVENNIVGSRFENEALLKGKLRRPRLNKSRPHVKERRHGKQQFPSSEVSRKPVSKKRKSNEETSVFTGPKSLHQIKEEKKKAEQNGDSFGKMQNSGISASEDFQGPKPLSEILKDKRRPGLVTDGYNDRS